MLNEYSLKYLYYAQWLHKKKHYVLKFQEVKCKKIYFYFDVSGSPDVNSKNTDK